MNQWLNRSHPQTLQAGVILGYISAVFGLIFIGPFIFLLLVYIGLGVGAFATANNKRWGYVMLAICAVLAAGWRILFLVLGVLGGLSIESNLMILNSTVFPTALVVAVLHIQSREYQKVWFE